MLQRSLQVILQPLQSPAQVFLHPGGLLLQPLTSLELQLSLEERGLQSQNFSMTVDTFWSWGLLLIKTSEKGEENTNEKCLSTTKSP